MSDIDALAFKVQHTLALFRSGWTCGETMTDRAEESWLDAKDCLSDLVAIAKDAQMKERALTDYFADASRRADKERKRADAAEREQDEQRSLKVLAYQQLDLTKARVAALERAGNARVWYGHNDTCQSVLDTEVPYPCSCGQDALLAALASPDPKEGTL